MIIKQLQGLRQTSTWLWFDEVRRLLEDTVGSNPQGQNESATVALQWSTHIVIFSPSGPTDQCSVSSIALFLFCLVELLLRARDV
jgi:hypothetical protein